MLKGISKQVRTFLEISLGFRVWGLGLRCMFGHRASRLAISMLISKVWMIALLIQKYSQMLFDMLS